MTRFPQIIAVLAGVFFVVAGAWALAAPRSFFETLAVFEPYNRHFIHDIGAFQIGLGAVLLLGVLVRDGLLVALAGVGVAAVLHVVSHLLDRGIGGEPATDIPFFGLVAALLVAAAAARAVAVSSRGSTR